MSNGGSRVLDAIERTSVVVGALLSQAPWVTTLTGAYPLSLYNPSIYHDKKLFVLVPLAVAAASSWWAIWGGRRVMAVLFAAFLGASGLVYWIYETFPPDHWMHPINWILSYVAFALFVAILGRVAVDILKAK